MKKGWGGADGEHHRNKLRACDAIGPILFGLWDDKVRASGGEYGEEDT